MGEVFISYRRIETASEATSLYWELIHVFGQNQVFMDSRVIKPGSPLPETIRKHLASCDALIAMIGSQWIHVTDRHGRRRLEDPNDYVRVEIATALKRDILVIPVLVQGALIPSREDLPAELGPLVDRLGLQVSGIVDPYWDHDVGRLIEALSSVLSKRDDRAGVDARTVVPMELPRPISDFAGRSRELALLKDLLAPKRGRSQKARRSVVIGVINGMAGVGKSALAIQVARELAGAGAFPDGQLYVNLGSTSGLARLDPLEALGRMLIALGVAPGQVPAYREEAAARYRSLIAGRRLLVLLDNASGPEDVRPLLPASSTCAVLVTSRRVLATLEGIHSLHLDVLLPDQALQLLGSIVGEERIAADTEAAAEVLQYCGHLPLAIRIAGARLAARPGWGTHTLAARLADPARRLEELEFRELAMRASFDISLNALEQSSDPVDKAAADAFVLLSLPDGPDLSVLAAAKLLDKPEGVVQRLLERLTDVRMLESPHPDRYQFHNLMRLYANQRIDRLHPESKPFASLTRLFAFYAATAWAALSHLQPGSPRLDAADRRREDDPLFPDRSRALAWLEAERANLMAAVSQTAACAPAVPTELARQLTSALFEFLVVRGHWQDGVRANQIVLELAQRTDDRSAQACARVDLGAFCMRLGRYEEALASLEESLVIWRELGDPHGQAEALRSLGDTLLHLGRDEQAEAAWEKGLAISESVQLPEAQAFRDRLTALSRETVESPGSDG